MCALRLLHSGPRTPSCTFSLTLCNVLKLFRIKREPLEIELLYYCQGKNRIKLSCRYSLPKRQCQFPLKSTVSVEQLTALKTCTGLLRLTGLKPNLKLFFCCFWFWVLNSCLKVSLNLLVLWHKLLFILRGW